MAFTEVIGQGMNAEELRANPRLTLTFVQDLNHGPMLPLEADSCDAALCCVGASSSLYERMLQRHMQAAGLGPRPGESLQAEAERAIRIRSQRSICELELRMRIEDQFIRKVEINSDLRDAKALREKLLSVRACLTEWLRVSASKAFCLIM